MRTRIAVLAVAALFLVAAALWRHAVLTAPTSADGAVVDAERQAIDRTLERTLRESRTGVAEPLSAAAPLIPARRQSEASLREDPSTQTGAPERDADVAQPPEGYTPGAYRGAMQRAPLTPVREREPSPNPGWLGTGSATNRILDQAAASGRGFTFAVLRVLPGTNLRSLNHSLADLGSRIEGSTGPYVRIRAPAERSRLEAIAGLAGVLGVGAVPPELKADEAFVREMLSRAASVATPAYITLMAEDPAGEWRRALTGLGVTVGAYDRDLRSYTTNLPAGALAAVIAADYVMSVEPVPVVTANHFTSVPVMGVDGVRDYDELAARFTGITGSGVAVGILDTGLNTSHVDIAFGRTSICGYSATTAEDWDLWVDLLGHGTHVFGTIAGAGRSNPLLGGIAPRLSHLRIAKVLSLSGRGSVEDVRRGMDYLSRRSSCSWQGSLSEAVKPPIVNMSLAAASLTFSGRGVGERKLDSVVHAHSQLYVVAQANRGIHGFSNFGTAKNSLSVGAVDDTAIIAPFSSHGPTADGRLAPSVVGTGVELTSVRGAAAASGHITASGTSMASPSVAGVAALLMEERPEFRDRPALSRARLMASAIRPHVYLESRDQLPADNTDGPGAFQNQYGLGLVSARTTLLSNDEPEGWIIGSATSEPDNDSYEYIDIEVPEGAGRLDVVLTWDEQPADTLTRSVLNNLDLWADQGADCTGEACGEHSSRSEIDNVEWLLIRNPVPGAYRIKVIPVEIYGEQSTAAVAWKILRGEPVPQLNVELLETSESADSEFITVDVTVSADRYVASGTAVRLGCRDRMHDYCSGLRYSRLSYRDRVYRDDGLSWSDPALLSESEIASIAVGEVAAGAPKRVRLWFERSRFPDQAVLHVTASSWNATGAGQSLPLGARATPTDSTDADPSNDSFATASSISGNAGETVLDLVLASREPGEPLVSAVSKTLWYSWEAPSQGLFRFRLQDVESGAAMRADFALFVGDSLTGLDVVAEKEGGEISFAAQAGILYRLRIASDEWETPTMVLGWESADTRPANDDFAYAQVIEEEQGELDSTNEGATLETGEFHDGAASVWYNWTAPSDGWWLFSTNAGGLTVNVFVGERVDELRVVSVPYATSAFPAKAGETYRIAVVARSAESSGAGYVLRWHPVGAPGHPGGENDLFENAVGIEGVEGAVDDVVVLEPGSSYRFLQFTVEHGEPIESGIATGWWHWTAPSDGRFTWRMVASPAYRLTIFSGDALESLAFVGSLNGGNTFVLNATGGTRYWIAVGREPNNLSGPYEFFDPHAFAWGPTPDNDDRASAISIAGDGGSAAARLEYATTPPSDPADTVGADSLWWQWRAPRNGWQRFWVEGHPLSKILAVYPAGAATRAIADSERSYFTNGRVEVRVLAQAGQDYDIRLASRPGVPGDASATVRWEASDAPAVLSYKGPVTIDSLAPNPLAQGFRAPYNLAMSEDGNYLFSSSSDDIFAFVRDAATGELAFAYRATAQIDQHTSIASALRQAYLSWNPRHDRLLALGPFGQFSFALPEDGSQWLSRNEMTVNGARFWYRQGRNDVADSPDGKHIYAVHASHEELRTFSVDSPIELIHVHSVPSRGVADDGSMIDLNIGDARDMTFSSDGLHLYVLTDFGLLVFSRDATSGRLALAREIHADDGPDNPFQEFSELAKVSLGGNGKLLFVSGANDSDEIFFDFEIAIAAFDISTDPASPAHLDTLTKWHIDKDRELWFVRNHLSDTMFELRNRSRYNRCETLLPHTGRPATDVFCTSSYYVIEWNQAMAALEVTDFGVVSMDDRFGNGLPEHLGVVFSNDRRQAAQSPDGAHIYLATRFESAEYSDAIHVFERASAMASAQGGEDSGDVVTGPIEPADPADPDEPASGSETEPDPVTKSDCTVGLLVGIGESCTYPGTADEFSVNERGRASFLHRLAGIVIRIRNQTINGRVYNFEARHQGEGVWRINVVGESM